LSRRSANILAVRQFQSEADAIRETPEPRLARLTIFVLGGLFTVMLLLTCVARIDRDVTSRTGKIVPTGRVAVFQSLGSALIKSIDVREGQKVEKGQVLATLDPTFAQADVTQLKLQIASLEAQVARAEGELSGKTTLAYKPTDDVDDLRYQGLQLALFDQRMAQYAAQINSFDAKIKQLNATLEKLVSDQGRYQQREQIAQRIEKMRTTLADNGTGSQLNMLLSQDSRIELTRSLELSQNTLVETKHTLESAKADRESFLQQWSTALSQEIVAARNTLDTAKAQYDKALKRADLVSLAAQEPSIVLTVAKLSVGSVLREGDPFITMMPENSPVEAEVPILSRDVGFIRPGDKCSLRVEAFNYTEHGTAEGTVRWISEGAFTIDDNGQPTSPYYKARCSVEQMNFRYVPDNFRLIPGMTLSAAVKVGTRSLMTYMLDGLFRAYTEAMREP
jgi:hemolysin D